MPLAKYYFGARGTRATFGNRLCGSAPLQDYNGGRSMADLKKFASENLGPTSLPLLVLSLLLLLPAFRT